MHARRCQNDKIVNPLCSLAKGFRENREKGGWERVEKRKKEGRGKRRGLLGCKQRFRAVKRSGSHRDLSDPDQTGPVQSR